MAVKDRKDRARKVLSAKRMADATSSKASRAFVVPDGVSLLSLKEGTYLLNPIPFTASMTTAAYDEGSLAISRPYFAHKRIGPNKDTYLCLARTFGKPCPVCEHGAQLERDPEATEDQKKACWPSQRALWLFEDLKEAPGELRLVDHAHHNLGKHIFAKAQRKPEYDAFGDPVEGFTIELGVSKDGKGKMVYYDANDVQFTKRDEPISDALLDSAPCLDDCITAAEIPYDELKSLYYQGAVEEGEQTADGKAEVESGEETNEETNGQAAHTTRRRAASAEAPEPNDDPTAEECGFEIGMQVEHEEFGICTIVKISPDGTSIRLEDEEMGIHTAIAPRDCTLVEQEPEAAEEPEEEPELPRRRTTAPQTQTRRAPAKGGRDLDFDEEPEEEPEVAEEPEEEPEPPRRRTTAPAAATRKSPSPATNKPAVRRR